MLFYKASQLSVEAKVIAFNVNINSMQPLLVHKIIEAKVVEIKKSPHYQGYYIDLFKILGVA